MLWENMDWMVEILLVSEMETEENLNKETLKVKHRPNEIWLED